MSGVVLNKAKQLANLNLTKANLKDVKLNEVKVWGNFDEADLSNGDFSDANLRYETGGRSSLSKANLSGANLSGANLTDVDFAGTNLSKANLKSSKLSDGSFSTSPEPILKGTIMPDGKVHE